MAGDATVRCPACDGHASRAFVARDLNRAVSDTAFAYGRCHSCGTYFIETIPPDLHRYYPRDYYTPLSVQELDTLAPSEQAKVAFLLDRIEPGRLIEIGPGTGVFARAAQCSGFDVTAIEMDGEVCDHLNDVVGIAAIRSDAPEDVLPTLPPSRAVAMWHVIEHVPNPVAVLAAATGNLEPGGVMVIATPNPDALQFRMLQHRWAHVDAPRHLHLIPSRTLRERCEQLGLQHVLTTTSDPAGRHWNWFGWEYALRRAPRSRPAPLAIKLVSRLLTLMVSPLEGTGINGCTYTSIFQKPATRERSGVR